MERRLAALLVCSCVGSCGLGSGRASADPALAAGERSTAAPAALRERFEVWDRHGDTIAHLPPLERDAACAPDLFQSVRRAGRAPLQGALVRTVLDGGLQALAQRALQRGVERLARAPRRPPADPATDQKEPPLAVGQTRIGTVLEVREREIVLGLGRAPATTTGILPLPPPILCTGHDTEPLPPPAERFHPGEALTVRLVALRQPAGGLTEALLTLQPQAALVVLDPRTRDILALVGGYGQRPYDFDRATQGRRQAGSTWKPLVYAAALEARRHQLSDVLEDLPRRYGAWGPRNFSGTYLGPVRLRAALAQSVNTIAVQILDEIGPGPVVNLAARLGIPPKQVPRDLTQALGTALVSPLQLAGAYATLADTTHGAYMQPRLLVDESPASTPALSPAVAYLVTSLLQSVVQKGTATRAKELGIPTLAGKTGTTTQGRDAWFVGYDQELLAVVWIGDDSPTTLAVPESHLAGSDRTGAETALPLWLDFMRDVQRAENKGHVLAAGRRPQVTSWPRPSGLSEVRLPDGTIELVLQPTPATSTVYTP